MSIYSKWWIEINYWKHWSNGGFVKISLVNQRVGGQLYKGWWVGDQWVGGGPVGMSVEHLSVGRWSVLSGQWVGGALCRWVGGRLSVVAGWLLVVGGLSMVGGFVTRRFFTDHLKYRISWFIWQSIFYQFQIL